MTTRELDSISVQQSGEHISVGMPPKSDYKKRKVVHEYYGPSFQNINNQLYYDFRSKQTHFLVLNSYEKHCSLDSSSARGSHTLNNSTSTVSFSSCGSPTSQQDAKAYASLRHHSSDNVSSSPTSASCISITHDVTDFKHKLRELEMLMLGPDSVSSDSHHSISHGASHMASQGTDSWGHIMGAISGQDLKEVLIACAKAVSEDDFVLAQWFIEDLRQMVSVSGEPLQRLGAYLLEGLVARLASSGSSICKVLRCKEPASPELSSYMRILYEGFPYFKFGYMSANGVIAEAMKDEDSFHIIDFHIAHGTQWVPLIKALARHGRPRQIRITSIDDSISAYAHGGGLSIVGKRLSKLAESFQVPFEFRAVAIPSNEVQLENLGVRPGEALAVNFAFMLHHMPDESVSTENHRDRLLRLVKSLSPKVVTLVEQESNTNTAAFFPRFREVMNYYAAVFESIDEAFPRDHKVRIKIEQHCLAREVVNIVACEGAERVERHELFGKWRSRFMMAGFTPYPLSSLVNATIKGLLKNHSYKYSLEERDGALYLGWMNRNLIASSAWT